MTSSTEPKLIHYNVAKDIDVRVRFHFNAERSIEGVTYYLSIRTPQELQVGMVIRLGEIPLPELKDLSNTLYVVKSVLTGVEYGLVYYTAEAIRTIGKTNGSTSELFSE